MDRVLELVAIVHIGLARPHLQLLEQHRGADLVKNLALGGDPQFLLLRRIGGDPRRIDLGIGDGEWEKLVTAVGVLTVEREWKNWVR